MPNKTNIKWSKDVHLKMKEFRLKSYTKSENIAKCLTNEVCMLYIDFLNDPIIDKIISVHYRDEKVIQVSTGYYMVKYVNKIREIPLEEQLLWKLKN